MERVANNSGWGGKEEQGSEEEYVLSFPGKYVDCSVDHHGCSCIALIKSESSGNQIYLVIEQLGPHEMRTYFSIPGPKRPAVVDNRFFGDNA